MRGSLGLPSLPDQALALDAVRRAPRFVAKADGLLSEPLFECGCLHEMTLGHGAAPCSSEAGAQPAFSVTDKSHGPRGDGGSGFPL